MVPGVDVPVGDQVREEGLAVNERDGCGAGVEVVAVDAQEGEVGGRGV